MSSCALEMRIVGKSSLNLKPGFHMIVVEHVSSCLMFVVVVVVAVVGNWTLDLMTPLDT